MRNYKILVIILLTISITMTISISYAQISEQIPSPKKQIDNGAEPHDVVCRDDLILVDRGMNKIACVKKITAQKMNWEIINNTLVEKSNIVKNNEIDVVFETITSTYNSNGHGIGSSFLTPMTTFTFPHNVTVGETFFINYTIDWVDENGTLLYPTLYSDGSNIEFYPFILASNEFSVLNNSFNLVRVMADKNASQLNLPSIFLRTKSYTVPYIAKCLATCLSYSAILSTLSTRMSAHSMLGIMPSPSSGNTVPIDSPTPTMLPSEYGIQFSGVASRIGLPTVLTILPPCFFKNLSVSTM